MAKYTVKHTCGHERVIQLIGKHEIRMKKIAWLEAQPCPDCSMKSAAEDALNKGYDLPELKGTKRQVLWALGIRDELIESLDIPETLQKEASTEDEKLSKAAILKIINNNSAVWWIEHRAAADILAAMRKEYQRLKAPFEALVQ